MSSALLRRLLHRFRFDQKASKGYDAEIARKVLPPFYRRAAEEVTADQREGELLDIGTGPGALLLEIAQKAPRMRLTGIDLSPAMVQLAQDKVARAGLGNSIALSVGDAHGLRFADGRFDVVTCTFVLHTCRDPRRVLGEIHRVLKPGGLAFVYDFRGDVPREERRSVLRGMRRLGVRRSWRFIGRLAWSMGYTKEELAALTRASRFRHGQVEGIHVEGWPLLRVVLRKAAGGRVQEQGAQVVSA